MSNVCVVFEVEVRSVRDDETCQVCGREGNFCVLLIEYSALSDFFMALWPDDTFNCLGNDSFWGVRGLFSIQF